MKYLFWAVSGYLSGSVLYSWLIAKAFCGVDIRRQSDDANPGAVNAFLHAGAAAGLAGAGLDLLKGFVPVFLAVHRLDPMALLFAAVLAAPVLGHAFPLFSGFRGGGKSIAVSFGVLLGLVPLWTPALLLAFYYLLFSLVLVIDPHLFRSVAAFALFAVTVMLRLKMPSLSLGCGLIAGIVIQRHLACRHKEKPALHLGLRRARRAHRSG